MKLPIVVTKIAAWHPEDQFRGVMLETPDGLILLKWEDGKLSSEIMPKVTMIDPKDHV